MNNEQLELLDGTLNNLQDARYLLSEYDSSNGKKHSSDMVRRINGLINAVVIEMDKV